MVMVVVMLRFGDADGGGDAPFAMQTRWMDGWMSGWVRWVDGYKRGWVGEVVS